jgi:uncharacterized protein YlxP (DUF503 family)
VAQDHVKWWALALTVLNLYVLLPECSNLKNKLQFLVKCVDKHYDRFNCISITTRIMTMQQQQWQWQWW